MLAEDASDPGKVQSCLETDGSERREGPPGLPKSSVCRTHIGRAFDAISLISPDRQANTLFCERHPMAKLRPRIPVHAHLAFSLRGSHPGFRCPGRVVRPPIRRHGAPLRPRAPRRGGGCKLVLPRLAHGDRTVLEGPESQCVCVGGGEGGHVVRNECLNPFLTFDVGSCT